jgi:hypothetical protein
MTTPESQSPALRRVLILVLLAVYLPTLIGFFSDCDHCRSAWRHLFAVVPGGVAVECVRYVVKFEWPGEATTYAVSATVTLMLLVALVLVGKRSRGWLFASVLAGLAWSGFASIVAYMAIRA